MAKKPRLGRGLSSLMSAPVPVNPPVEVEAEPTAADAPTATADNANPTDESSASNIGNDAERISYIAVDRIQPNPHQPREHFEPAALKSLGRSIQQDGLMQPIVLRASPTSDDTYELVAGERRWRAATAVGIAQLPAIVRDLTDRQLAEWALIENLQREDLNPIEKAKAFHGLSDQFNLSQQDIADRVGIERSTVANYLRLLELPEQVATLIGRGPLTMGHAKALLSIPNADVQAVVAAQALKEAWSVRETEKQIRAILEEAGVASGSSSSGGPTKRKRSSHLKDLEQQVANQLQTKVKITPGRRKGSGTIAIDFHSIDEFDQLLAKLGVELE